MEVLGNRMGSVIDKEGMGIERREKGIYRNDYKLATIVEQIN